MYKVFLNTLVATSWNAFAGDMILGLQRCLSFGVLDVESCEVEGCN